MVSRIVGSDSRSPRRFHAPMMAIVGAGG